MNIPKPTNHKIERAVIGTILTGADRNNSAMELAQNYLKAECFTLDYVADLYTEMVAMHKAGRPTNLLTVTEWVKGKPFFNVAGSVAWITGLSADYVLSHLFEDYCRLLYELYVKRSLMDIGQKLYNDAHKADPFELRLEAEQLVSNMAIITTNGQTSRQVMDLVNERFSQIERGELVSIPTGLPSLDEHIGGLNKGDLIVIGTYPSNGKTSLAMNMVLHAAGRGYRCKVYSFEMNSTELFKKQIGFLSGISPKEIEMRHRYTEHGVQEAVKIVGDMPTLYDSRCRKLNDFIVDVKNAVNRGGVQMVVVDYIQLMSADKMKRLESIGEIANTMKALATELQIPFLVLSQLRRAEGKIAGAPKMDMLKESGDIEAAADVIILPWMPANPPTEQQTVMFNGVEVDTQVGELKRMFISVPKGRNYGVTKFEAWIDTAQRIYEPERLTSLGKNWNEPTEETPF
jgi:replicative DNA helicase